MNQILNKLVVENTYNSNNFNNNSKKKILIILFSSIILIVVALLIYFFIKYNSVKNENLSKDLVSNYNIKTLYSNTNNDYTATKIISELTDEPFVIGLIQIDSISLTYPILSTTSEELLTISPCRFYGPMPNEIGNLCIAGHNYVDNKQFGKLNSLKIDDIVKIFDLSGNFIEYIIYEKKQISADDLSCTNQNTDGKREITLITCNNIKGNRVCIKAKEI